MMKNRSRTVAELSTIQPFDQLPKTELRTLASHVDRLRLRRGAVLAREGAQAREFIVVLSGEVSVERSGHKTASMGAGSQIGGAAVVHRDAHDSTWLAESELDVLVVNGPAYRWATQVLPGATAA